MNAIRVTLTALFVISVAFASLANLGVIFASDNKHTGYSVPPAPVEAVTGPSTRVKSEGMGAGSQAGSEPAQYRLANKPKLPISDDPYTNRQWALTEIQVYELWQRSASTAGVPVAILDTGIDRDHEELNGLIIAEADFTDHSSPADVHGHGTHVAGVIGAKNNGRGIVGVAPGSPLLNGKVADDRGRCQASSLAKAIIWAVDSGAKVINISVEISTHSAELEEAVNYAWNRGAVLIAAAGNRGNQLPVYPAYYENCIAVAAMKQDGSLAPLSNYGDWVDVAAPGFDMYSTLPDNHYGFKSGTSFATAHVSGLAALLFSVVADTTGDGRLNDEVRAAIEAGCQEIGIDGVGPGRIDAANSLAEIGYTP